MSTRSQTRYRRQRAADRCSLLIADSWLMRSADTGAGVNYHWNWGIFFQTSPDGVHTYLETLLLGTGWTLATALSAWCLALAWDRSSASFAPRRIPGWCGSATPMSNCSATSRCWCRCSSGTSCCRRWCRRAIGDWLKQLPDASFYTAVVALGFYTSARVAEQVRAGILSLARGQRMAALALGLTLPQTYVYVLLPMAYRIILPPLTSEFLNIIKNSAVALTIGLMELDRARARHAGILVPGVRGLHRRDHHLHRHQHHRDVRHARGRAPHGGPRLHRRQHRRR